MEEWVKAQFLGRAKSEEAHLFGTVRISGGVKVLGTERLTAKMAGSRSALSRALDMKNQLTGSVTSDLDAWRRADGILAQLVEIGVLRLPFGRPVTGPAATQQRSTTRFEGLRRKMLQCFIVEVERGRWRHRTPRFVAGL